MKGSVRSYGITHSLIPTLQLSTHAILYDVLTSLLIATVFFLIGELAEMKNKLFNKTKLFPTFFLNSYFLLSNFTVQDFSLFTLDFNT